eukprot:gene5471-6155_t
MSKRQRNNFPSIRLVLLGQGGVGKSALVVRFLTRRFIGEYDTTESTHSRHITIGNSTLIVEIKDTAGESQPSKRDEDIANGDAFILVFSITSRDSFDEVKKMKQLIDSARNSSAVCIIIGNKKDLHHFREVGSDEGRGFADKNACPFYEISVAEGYHETNRVFNDVLKHIIVKKANDEGLSGKKKSSNTFSYILKGLEKSKQAR